MCAHCRTGSPGSECRRSDAPNPMSSRTSTRSSACCTAWRAGPGRRCPARSRPAFAPPRSCWREHTRALLGSAPAKRSVRIMVTLGQRGGVGLRARSRHACQRHGLCPHQLCARRCAGMGRDGSQHPARARRVAAPLSHPVRPRRTQAAHRADRTRTRSAQVAPAARRVRPRARARPHLLRPGHDSAPAAGCWLTGGCEVARAVWQRAIASS